MKTNTAVIFINTIEEQEQFDDLFTAIDQGFRHLKYIGAGLSVVSQEPLELGFAAEKALCVQYRNSNRGDKTSILLNEGEKAVMVEVHRDIFTPEPTHDFFPPKLES